MTLERRCASGGLSKPTDRPVGGRRVPYYLQMVGSYFSRGRCNAGARAAWLSI